MGTATVDLKNLPSLPGFNIEQYKENHHKNSSLRIVDGMMMEGKMIGRQKQFKQELDRLVLRFFGYFKEAVVETNLENYRVRRIMLYYYLEDDSCHIIEPRQDNSGIPQGQLVRRHKFPAPDGGYVTPQDIKVGTTFSVYGKTFYITDADPFTREYCQQMGFEQPEAVEEVVDHFTQIREAMKQKPTTHERTHEKLYREVMLGGGHVNEDMQQFLENDRHVLRFFAILDDVNTPTFERRPFVILFFLADDTIELREMYPLNCGRDNFPIFFRRGKMPMGAYATCGPQDQRRNKSDYVHGHDFAVGMSVNLLGNLPLFIYDADDFTREYFREKLSVELEPAINVQMPDRTVPKAPEPPYTGYGSWEDSMGSVTHLVPKPPRRDLVKLFEHEGKILRFKAKFANPKVEDQNRVFVVSFHLFDDTIAIHEPPQRNLGIVTGKFLEKGVHLNQVTGKLFQAEDLLPGQTIKIYNHEFLILDMDEYTRKRLADPNEPNFHFDLEAVLHKLRASLLQSHPQVRDIFRRLDNDHNGVLTFEEFKKALQKFNLNLQDTEIEQVMRHFDHHKNGQVSYNDFCDIILEEDYTQAMLGKKMGMDLSGPSQVYSNRANQKSVERSETAEVRRAVHKLGEILYNRRAFLTRLFKEFKHYTHEPFLSCEQLRAALQGVAHFFDLEDIQRAVLFVNPDQDLDKVYYVEFFKAIQATYHDFTNTSRG